MAKGSNFKRIVLGLPYPTPSHGMRLGAELARLLELELLGLFVEDRSLLELVSLPFIREFDFLGGGWNPLDMKKLSRDLEIAARTAERAFKEAAKMVATRCRFEVLHGSMADAIASSTRPGDIVLLFGETANAAQGGGSKWTASLDAAFQSSSAVLLAPARIARQSGAIIAIATRPGDQSIETAGAIAAAAKEELIVVENFAPAATGRPCELPPGTEVPLTPLPPAHGRPRDAWAIAAGLRHASERLVVMTRGDDSLPLSIASERHIPVLIISRRIADAAAA